ncbi:unnamed protein product, partial [Brenthis ino]
MESQQGNGSQMAVLLIDALFSECELPDRSKRKWCLPVDNLHFLCSPLRSLLGVVICLSLDYDNSLCSFIISFKLWR